MIPKRVLARREAGLGIDCVKTCPYDSTLFAFAFYQQLPELIGGVSVRRISKQLPPPDFSLDIATAPVLHLEWLDRPLHLRCMLLAATRDSRVLIMEYTVGLTILREIVVCQGLYCLYLDCRWEQDGMRLLVSTNQSKVYEYRLVGLEIEQTSVYAKHEYAVWSCRYQQSVFACGDEVGNISLYQAGHCIGKYKAAGGICDIAFQGEYAMHVGAFDGLLYTYDTRLIAKEVSRNSIGETIWRVIPKGDSFLICDSSSHQFKLIDKTGVVQWTSEKEHTSLAYAADANGEIAITASFYDKVVNVWE